MPAGYSGTPLIKKPGIKPATKVLLINPPENYHTLLEKEIDDQLCGKNENPDLIHVFVRSKKEFVSQMKKLKPVYKKNTTLTIWVSWYKKSSGIPTDITENDIRSYALSNGLIDVKVCAVSELWSGLKLVVPLIKR